MLEGVAEISGFTLVRVLGTGATSTVYHAQRGESNYAIKVIKGKQSSASKNELHRFMREASTIAKLNHPGIVKIHEVGETEGRPYLVMELVEGEPLKRRLERGRMSEFEALKLAHDLAPILDYFHCRGVVHKDLKPENILINARGEVKIIDFGFATELNDHRMSLDGSSEVVGTLLYAAPEQTGLIRRMIDCRSDLYALGGLIYHCCVGRPPFEGSTALELIEKRLTVKPTDPSQLNHAIRPAFAATILKLLARDPDDRYQSAKGFLSDLENLTEIERAGAPFQLGKRDSGLRVLDFPLVGRTVEMTAMTEIRNHFLRGQGSVLLVSGEGGSGKTRLLRETLLAPSPTPFMVLQGKAKQGEKVPFGAIRDAIEDLTAAALRGQEKSHKRVIDAIRDAAGDLAGIIRRLSPSLHGILHDAREIPPLDGNAEQERFYLKVAEFLLALTRSLGPIALKIDDIQWLDEGSVEICRQISKQISGYPLLLAATSRNDSSARSAMEFFITATKDGGLTHFPLKPLELTAVEQLVSAHLGGKPLDVESVKLIAAKANGNPFAIAEYLRALVDKGLIKPTESSWVFDSEKSRELQLPDDVIQLLINRIESLNAMSIKILAIASVIGFEFSVDLLVAATEGERGAVNRTLAEGLQSGLIEKTSKGYAFVHDRVSEALLATISAEDLKQIHQVLAEALEADKNDYPQKIYAIARHYFCGFAERNLEKIYKTSLAAGVQALDLFSNDEAIELLERALKSANSLGIKGVELCSIHESLGLAYTRNGKPRQAIEHFNIGLTLTESTLVRAHLHYLLGLARASEGKHEQAKNELFEALKLLKEPFASSLLGSIYSLIRTWIAAEYRIRTRRGYGEAEGSERERRKLVAKVYSTMNLLAYLLGDELLMVQSILRALHNSQFLGTSAETAKAHVYYAVLGSFLTLKKMTDKHGRIAIDMAHQIGDQEAIAYCELNYAIAIEFTGDVVRSHEMVIAAYPKVIRYSAAWEKSVAIGHRTHMMTAGKARENLAWIEKTMPVLHQTGDLGMIHTIYSSLFVTHQMLGETAEAARAVQLQKQMPPEVGASRLTGTSQYIDFLHGWLVQEDFGPQIEPAIAELLRIGIDGYHTRNRFAVIGFVRIEQIRRSKNAAEKKKLMRSLAAMVRRSGFPNALTPLHQCLHYALKGAMYALREDARAATKAFAKAEELAQKSDNQWIQWLIERERARLADGQGRDSRRDAHARAALKIATSNGWVPHIKQIQRDFKVALPAETLSTIEGQAGSDGSDSIRISYGRLRTAERNAEALLQISLASASSLNPEKQTRAILDTLVRVLNAERAFLFEQSEKSDGHLVIRAGRDIDKNDIAELTGYSSTIISKVAFEKQALVVSGTDDGELMTAESVVAHNLRSILAAPVVFRERFVGVLYLDSTIAKGIFTEDDLQIVSALANHIAIGLEAVRSANIEIENRSMKKDLEVISAVQSLTLPKKSQVDDEKLKMAAYYRAANQSGGDWWWYDHDADRQTFSVLMGDVTGHGVGPAMISATVSGIYQAFKAMRSQEKSLRDFLKILNEALFNLAQTNYLVSMNAIEIDLRSGRLKNWSAGAPPLYMIKPDGSIHCASGMGMWLGSEEFAVEEEVLQMAPGDRIAIFTDGLFEMEMSNGRQFGLKRLEKLLLQGRSEPVAAATAQVINKIQEVSISETPNDDITFVLIDYQGPQA